MKSEESLEVVAGQPGWQQVYKRFKGLHDDGQRHRILLTGLCGSGKSTIGKIWRKKGFGAIPARDFWLIDSHVINLPIPGLGWTGLFRRKRVSPPEGYTLDFYEPYIPKRARFILFITNKPQKIVDHASLILKIRLDEKKRLEFLEKRYSHDPQSATRRFKEQTYHLSDTIPSRYRMEVEHRYSIEELQLLFKSIHKTEQ
jgi:hypothetical protein